MSGFSVRAAKREDSRALTDALVEARNWNPDVNEPRVSIMADPAVRRYIAAWGRPGDAGVVAEDSEKTAIGACWYRLFSAQEPGFGFIGTGVPELILGVSPVWRAQGVGRAMLREVLQQARAAGFARISLSVQQGNYAHRLYRSEGFAVVETRGTADVMVHSLN
jgi:GNAT superfamily N-acetyltransferase